MRQKLPGMRRRGDGVCGGGRSASEQARGRCRFARLVTAVVPSLLTTAPGAVGQIPGVVETYPVNDATNGVHDIGFGEFGPDAGGTVP